jgi:Caspase domain
MKPAILILLATLVASAGAARAESPSPGVARVAVVVGANAAAPGRKPLYYGHKDAERVADVLTSVGGFRRDDVRVLRDPEPGALLATLKGAIATLDPKRESLFYFYYSGHADADALYPAGKAVPLDNVRALLDGAPASVRIGMVDACRGGRWTRAKGLSPAEPFTVRWPVTLDSEGSVLIASSSGDESAHESDELQGSFFTHHFLVGMRGVADRNGNNEITLTEAFEYAKERTIRDTIRMAHETQHPSYAVNLRGRRDLVLAQITAGTSAIELAQKQGPLELIHADSGVGLLELPPGQRQVKLVVPPGRYLVRKKFPSSILVKDLVVAADGTTRIDEADLVLVGSNRLSAKGTAPAFVTAPAVPPARPPVSTWVKAGSIVSLIGVAGSLALAVKYSRDVAYYDDLIDPLRRFPCNANDKSHSCDRNGQPAPPLTPNVYSYQQDLLDEQRGFETSRYIAFGSAAAFAAVSVPLAYRWIRGGKPSNDADKRQAVVLVPTLGGEPGLAAVGRF